MIFQNTWNFVLDTIAPTDPFIREIEDMSAEEFIQRAKKIEKNTVEGDFIAFFSYKDPLVKAAILEVKSYGNKRIARLLGEVVHELLVLELEDMEVFYNFRAPLLLPIPMTRKSIRERGWNQCELLVQAITRYSDEMFETPRNALVKIGKTEDQVGKGRKERFANLAHVFIADSNVIHDRNVIVLDDIVTTGATLCEAKRALFEAGARKVLSVAIAH